MQKESLRGEAGPVSITALRREAAALQARAAQLTAASAQVERRFADLVNCGPAGRAQNADRARIALLKELRRESVRLLDAAVRRRAVLRRSIDGLERAARSTTPQAPSPIGTSYAREPR